jgi:hypothetical protein
MLPTDIIPAFDAFLAERGQRFEAVVIGSAALSLLGVVVRATDDCDVLDPVIPEAVLEAARDFAKARGELADDWLNCKSHDFVGVPGCLPEGWRGRLQPLFKGNALHFQTLGRQDLLCTKLVALVDRGTDFEDCVALGPSIEELQAAWPFVQNYEGNPESREVYWIPLAKRQLVRLCMELGLDGLF